MSYSMVHLSIADNILACTPAISNPSAFLLGSLAPDAVHFRAHYESSMKKASHLIAGRENWGEVADNEAWRGSVLAFLHAHANPENQDFLRGYCAHILVDILNNLQLWTPYRMAQGGLITKSMYGVYAGEAQTVDHLLYREHPHTDRLWSLIRNATAMTVGDLVSTDEIDRYRNRVLDEDFVGSAAACDKDNRYVTLTNMQTFISDGSRHVKAMLFPGS